jgi:hypothetical protein
VADGPPPIPSARECRKRKTVHAHELTFPDHTISKNDAGSEIHRGKAGRCISSDIISMIGYRRNVPPAFAAVANG